jgi:pyridoxamine 5'-phosphate oxidase
MTREEILKLLNSNQVSYLATVEDGEPRVRGMAHYRADDQGILYHTGKSKDLVAQLRKCPKAEVCVFDAQSGVQVRVRGSVEFVDDQALKEEIVAARPFLKPIVDAVGYEALTLFRVKDCLATVWTMSANMEPKTFVKL